VVRRFGTSWHQLSNDNAAQTQVSLPADLGENLTPECNLFQKKFAWSVLPRLACWMIDPEQFANSAAELRPLMTPDGAGVSCVKVIPDASRETTAVRRIQPAAR
jgi:hypothetical protein